MKKLAVFLLVCVMSLSTLVGCGPSGNDGKTIIRIMNVGGGIGRVWLDEAIERYKEIKPDVSFKIENNISTGVETMNTAGYNIYFVEDDGTVVEIAGKNYLLPINDLLTDKDQIRGDQTISIEDKIDESYRAALKGIDGNYYALPHFAFFPGLTYDYDLFEMAHLYIADYDAPVNQVITHNSKFGEVKFTKNESSPKSVGSDGIPSTADDGLPCTLIEFLALCDYIKSQTIMPFELNGRSNHYISYLIRGLWASLAGYDELARTYNYGGEMTLVKRDNSGNYVYTSENLFSGIDYIKKPETERVTVTEQEGYRVYDSIYRYYATAVVEIMVKEGWLSSDSNGGLTHIDAQTNFINGGLDSNHPQYAFLIEGNYWYNESEDNGVFDDYAVLSGNQTRTVKWLTLPTSFDKPVTSSANARQYTMFDACGNSFAFINRNIEGNEPLVAACKDFLKFLYSDAELSHFVGRTGVIKVSLDFELLPEDRGKLSAFQKGVMDVYDNSKVLYSAGDNKTFKYHATELVVNGGSSVLKPTVQEGNSKRTYNNILQCVRGGNGYTHTTREIFEATKFDANYWSENIYEE